MINTNVLVEITILILAVILIDQTSAQTCKCGTWNGAYTYNYEGNSAGSTISGYCQASCSFGYAATGPANACCKCCCEQHSNYVGTCPLPTTCTATDHDCSVHSVLAGGYGYTFYTYFAGSGAAANGGAAAYCPKGTRHYADCEDACKDDEKYDPCVRCCKACCKPAVVSSRVFNDDDTFLTALRDALRSRTQYQDEGLRSRGYDHIADYLYRSAWRRK